MNCKKRFIAVIIAVSFSLCVLLMCISPLQVQASDITFEILSAELEKGNVPLPTKEVTNGTTGGTWGNYHVLESMGDIYRYRLNFGFPNQEVEEYNLSMFHAVTILPPAVSKASFNQIRVRTVQENVDVTEYFELISRVATGEDYPRQVLEIIALDTALNNSQFYREWRELYVVFEVRILTTGEIPIITGEEPVTIDTGIVSNFRVLGENYDGSVFNKVSNNVHTFYLRVFLHCGCYIKCHCDLPNEPINEGGQGDQGGGQGNQGTQIPRSPHTFDRAFESTGIVKTPLAIVGVILATGGLIFTLFIQLKRSSVN